MSESFQETCHGQESTSVVPSKSRTELLYLKMLEEGDNQIVPSSNDMIICSNDTNNTIISTSAGGCEVKANFVDVEDNNSGSPNNEIIKAAEKHCIDHEDLINLQSSANQNASNVNTAMDDIELESEVESKMLVDTVDGHVEDMQLSKRCDVNGRKVSHEVTLDLANDTEISVASSRGTEDTKVEVTGTENKNSDIADVIDCLVEEAVNTAHFTSKNYVESNKNTLRDQEAREDVREKMERFSDNLGTVLKTHKNSTENSAQEHMEGIQELDQYWDDTYKIIKSKAMKCTKFDKCKFSTSSQRADMLSSPFREDVLYALKELIEISLQKNASCITLNMETKDASCGNRKENNNMMVDLHCIDSEVNRSDRVSYQSDKLHENVVLQDKGSTYLKQQGRPISIPVSFTDKQSSGPMEMPSNISACSVLKETKIMPLKEQEKAVQRDICHHCSVNSQVRRRKEPTEKIESGSTQPWQIVPSTLDEASSHICIPDNSCGVKSTGGDCQDNDRTMTRGESVILKHTPYSYLSDCAHCCSFFFQLLEKVILTLNFNLVQPSKMVNLASVECNRRTDARFTIFDSETSLKGILIRY